MEKKISAEVRNAYKVQLKEVVNGMRIKKYAIEGNLQVALSYVKIKKFQVFVYGAGLDICTFIKFLNDEGIYVEKVIDADEEKRGKSLMGTEIISPSDFVKEQRKNAFVFIYACYNDSFREMQIMQVLKDAGVEKFFGIGGVRPVITNNTSEWVDSDRMKFYMEHYEELLCVMDLLDDEESIETMIEYVRTYMECDRYRLKQIPTKYKYFFGSDREEIYRHSDEEIWVNCGANVGDNIFTFFSENLKCKKIFAVEGDKKIAARLRENILLLPEEMQEKVAVVESFITDNTEPRSFLANESVSLINADIEGYELEMLQAMQNIIVNERPVLAICLYHKREDIIEIPRYIISTLKDYTLIMRKYAACRGNLSENHELVLYAVPNERVV